MTMRPRRLMLNLVVLAVAVASGVAAFAGEASLGARAAAPRPRSRPAAPLLTYVASDGAVCLIHADGSDPVRLTTRWKGASDLAWSPNGRYLAFSRPFGHDQWGNPATKITVADARGHIRWRFGEGTFNGSPLWSPDGSHIAYRSQWAHFWALNAARSNGLDPVGIAGSSGDLGGWIYGPADPAWTPDGKGVLFSDGDFDHAPQGIFTEALFPPGDRSMLIPGAAAPAFSPDGSKLAYAAVDRARHSTGIFISDANGQNPHRLTPAITDGQLPPVWSGGTPAWSPDGTRLAFVWEKSGVDELVVVGSDGSGERVLAKSPSGELSRPAWSPGGAYLAFINGDTLVLARGDGNGRRVLVANTRSDPILGPLPPAWRPAVALPAANRRRCRTR